MAEDHGGRNPRGYAAGLDGVRAIAVVAVVLYHAGVPAVRGGFVGVDLFFVVSGYLVTALLQREHDASGRIAIGAFLQRRARRLLPALAVMLTAVCAATLVLRHDLGAGLRSQLIGATTFSSNWIQLDTGSSYVSAAEPAVLTHLWSLAVEEQFYLLWPAVCVVLLTRLSARRRRCALVVVLALLSAVVMAVLFTTGSDPTRAYEGTDSHGFGLLLGAALALARPSSDVDPVLRRRPTAPRGGAAVLGPIALLVVIAGAVLLSDTASLTYRGGLLLVNVAAVVLVAMAVRGAGPVHTVLAHPWLRWTGRLSYAIYLWHWPAIVVADRILAPSIGHPAAATLAVAVAVAAAAASWRWVEEPIRRAGVAGYLRSIRRTLVGRQVAGRPRPTARRGVVGWVAVGTSGLVLGVAACSVVAAPRQSQLAVSLAAGEQAIAQASAGRPPAPPGSIPVLPQRFTSPPPVPTPSVPEAGTTQSVPATAPVRTVRPVPSQSPSTSRSTPVPGTTPPASDTVTSARRAPTVVKAPRATSTTGSPHPSLPTPMRPSQPPQIPQPAIDGSRLSAIGDSVMLASAPALLDRFPGADIDAVVSRQLWDLGSLVARQVGSGHLRPYLVIGLGTNGTDSTAHIGAALAQVPTSEVVVLVTAYVPDSWQDDVDGNLAAAAAARPHTCVADWHAAIGSHQDLLGPDGVHPGPDGGQLYASVVADAIRRCL